MRYRQTGSKASPGAFVGPSKLVNAGGLCAMWHHSGMRIAPEDEHYMQAHVQHIVDRGTLDAYWYMVGFSESLPGVQTRPYKKGEILDYRFFQDNEQWFAFIVNRNSLLFYFRLPALRSGRYSKEELARAFAEVSENNRGEITTRICSVTDARRVMAFAFLNNYR